eukprot:g1197.t1
MPGKSKEGCRDKATSKHQSELNTLENEISRLEKITGSKEQLLEKLEHAIARKRKQISDIKREYMQITGTWVADMNRKKMGKQLDMLRCKVAACERQCNSLQAHDEDVRCDIDDLRREKTVYMNCFKAVRADLQRTAREENELKEAVALAHRQRLRVIKELTELKHSSKKRAENLRSQIKELDETLDSENDVESLSRKDIKTEGTEKSSELETLLDIGTTAGEAVPSGKSERSGSSFEIGGHCESALTPLDYYIHMWGNIRKSTGAKSLRSMLASFQDMERIKLSRLREANELILELEQVRKDVGEDKSSYSKKNDSQHAELVAHLKSEMDKFRDASRVCDVERVKNTRAVTNLSAEVERLAAMLNEQELARTVESTLGVSGNALRKTSTEAMRPKSASSEGRLRESTRITNSLGEIQSQAMLLMQYYAAQIVDGTLKASGSKQRGLRTLRARGPQHAKGSIKKDITRIRSAIPHEIAHKNTLLAQKEARNTSGGASLDSLMPKSRVELEANVENWSQGIRSSFPVSRVAGGSTNAASLPAFA